MKFADMQPRMQEMRDRWAEQAKADARGPQIDAFAPSAAPEPSNPELSAAQTATPVAASPSRAELIAWAADMLAGNPRLFGITAPGFVGPPQSGRARLWDTSVRPAVELPLPELL